MTMERRSLTDGLEIRSQDDGTIRVSGYAAVFNKETEIGGLFRERVVPGAFRSAISRGDDVVFLVNHEGLPLARRSAGNLSLSEDSRGLKVEATLDGTDPDVQRIVPKLRNKLMSGMSFAFRAARDGQTWDYSGDGLALRSLTDFEFVQDVSVVNSPAYDGAEIALRSLEDARESAERELRERNAEHAKARIAARRAAAEQKFRGIKPE
jgi:hypothetical protein